MSWKNKQEMSIISTQNNFSVGNKQMFSDLLSFLPPSLHAPVWKWKWTLIFVLYIVYIGMWIELGMDVRRRWVQVYQQTFTNNASWCAKSWCFLASSLNKHLPPGNFPRKPSAEMTGLSGSGGGGTEINT